MSTTPTATTSSREPDISQLTRQGWTVLSAIGAYYSVWRGCEEALLLWKDGRWLRVGGQPADGR